MEKETYQPWYTGDTHPVLQFVLNTDGVPDNIAEALPQTNTTGTGVFTIVSTNPVIVSYQISSVGSERGIARGETV
jgi:hypothetical protein